MPTKKSNNQETTSRKNSTRKTRNAKAVTSKKATNSKNSTKNALAQKMPSARNKSINNTVEYYDLPNKYNETIVKVLFQTPKKLFVYWEISETDKQKLICENGKDFFENSTPFLIVKNKTKNYSFEIEVNDFANSWYFNVPDSKCEYTVELIRKNNSNHLPTQITASNELEVPNNHILFEQNRNEIFFKNVKTNNVTSKSIASLQFIEYAGKAKPITLNSFYNKFYNEKDLYSVNNPSSF